MVVLVESIGSCIVPMVQAFIILMIVTLLYRYEIAEYGTERDLV